MFLLLLSAFLYYLQSREDSFDKMRVYVILINLINLCWFAAIQYYRFKDTGRACSGDFYLWSNSNEGASLKQSSELVKTLKKSKIYLVNEGQWFLVYIISQYILFLSCKIVSIIITNKLESEFEEKKA